MLTASQIEALYQKAMDALDDIVRAQDATDDQRTKASEIRRELAMNFIAAAARSIEARNKRFGDLIHQISEVIAVFDPDTTVDGILRLKTLVGDANSLLQAGTVDSLSHAEAPIPSHTRLDLVDEPRAKTPRGKGSRRDGSGPLTLGATRKPGKTRKSPSKPTLQSAPVTHDRVTDVRVGVAAPDIVRRGEQFLAQFVAYPATDEEEQKVLEMLEASQPGAVAHLARLSCRWADNTPVTVRLTGDGVTVPESEKGFVWYGQRQTLDFLVMADLKARPGNLFLLFEVLIAGAPVGDVRLQISVVQRARKPKRSITNGAVVRSAFASYASADRPIVALIVGALKEGAGIDFFQDCLDLEQGENWQERLRKEIAERDKFWLFWSEAAAKSKWVKWEWRTALQLKGTAAIKPFSLPPPTPPPKALGKLHFDSLAAMASGYATYLHPEVS